MQTPRPSDFIKIIVVIGEEAVRWLFRRRRSEESNDA
jgi:hypothetical protein